MFQFEQNGKKAWWPVKVPMTQDGGTVAFFECELLFVLEDDFAKAMQADNPEADSDVLLMDHIVDWRMPGESDQPVPFTRENLQAAMKVKRFALATVYAYGAACRGAAVKNG